MRLLDGQLVLSPSDLTKFTRCAHVATLDLGRLRKTLKPLACRTRGSSRHDRGADVEKGSVTTASGERCAGRSETRPAHDARYEMESMR